MTEAQFQATLEELCLWLGLTCYHTRDSRKSNPGFPDLVLVGNAVIYAELKSAKGRLSPAQTHWIDRLVAAGQEVHVWRPADMDTIVARLNQLATKYPSVKEA